MSSGNRREVGPWGPIKNEIIEKYAKAYTTILRNQSWCSTLYVDVFAGSPDNALRGTGEMVAGSARRALGIAPPFHQYLFVDSDVTKTDDLAAMVGARKDAQVVHDDGNAVLRRSVIPHLERSNKVRSLILLDPYGMDLSWDVVARLGQSKRAEIILNFPMMDINRNAAHRTPTTIQDASESRMTAWWGDQSWRTSFFNRDYQLDLFGQPGAERKVVRNTDIVSAYCDRLRSEARFGYVAPPFPVKNSRNAVLYFLVFASPKAVAAKIMTEILGKYR